MTNTIEISKEKLGFLIDKHGFSHETIDIVASPLSKEEAIGKPTRDDFPLLQGKEVMMEARFKGHRGQAFTDEPVDFSGSIADVMNLPCDSNRNRAIFISTLNAIANYLGLVKNTLHCKDEAPEQCGKEIADSLYAKFGPVKVGVIGLQPAILQNLASRFGAINVLATDLNPKNIGTQKHGVAILDGEADTEKLINLSDVLLVTGTTIVNGTFDDIFQRALELRKPCTFFGVTIAGVAELLSLERLCLQTTDDWNQRDNTISVLL